MLKEQYAIDYDGLLTYLPILCILALVSRYCTARYGFL